MYPENICHNNFSFTVKVFTGKHESWREYGEGGNKVSNTLDQICTDDKINVREIEFLENRKKNQQVDDSKSLHEHFECDEFFLAPTQRFPRIQIENGASFEGRVIESVGKNLEKDSSPHPVGSLLHQSFYNSKEYVLDLLKFSRF